MGRYIGKEAPTARNIIARGKHERSECVAPGQTPKESQGLKGRNNLPLYSALTGLDAPLIFLSRGDALASLALAPGYHISRLWR
jgi:hypothetical protein